MDLNLILLEGFSLKVPTDYALVDLKEVVGVMVKGPRDRGEDGESFSYWT